MTERYDSPGKQKARDLVTAVFATAGGTVLDFFGGGRSAVQFAEAGLTVTSAESDESLHAELEWQSRIFGFEPFYGRASRIKRSFDHAFADFCGNASTKNRHELRRLAPYVRKWLAVTLSSDHQINSELQGASATATVPVWLIEATGMQLEYVGRYVRNEHGQTMWIALLTPRDPSMHGNQMISPLTISRDLRRRSYWATPDFRALFPDLVAHRSQSVTEYRRKKEREYYEANRDHKLALARDWYYRNKHRTDSELRAAYQREWRKGKADRLREYQRAYRAANPDKIAAIKARYRAKKEGRLGPASPA